MLFTRAVVAYLAGFKRQQESESLAEPHLQIMNSSRMPDIIEDKSKPAPLWLNIPEKQYIPEFAKSQSWHIQQRAQQRRAVEANPGWGNEIPKCFTHPTKRHKKWHKNMKKCIEFLMSPKMATRPCGVLKGRMDVFCKKGNVHIEGYYVGEDPLGRASLPCERVAQTAWYLHQNCWYGQGQTIVVPVATGRSGLSRAIGLKLHDMKDENQVVKGKLLTTDKSRY